MAEIYDKMESFKAALLKRERAASSRLVRAYGQSWQRLAKLLLQVTDKIGEAQARGIDISPAWLYQQERYARLMTELEREIRRFAATAERAVIQEQKAAIQAALRDSKALVKAIATPEISASFVSLNAAAVESAVGFLADGSPLSRLLDELPRETGRRVREALTEAVALGYNPRKTAARVRREAGMALTRALRIARTETLRAYREAAHANYTANDDIIQGWYWAASLSKRTCAACIALHGTFHPLEERMASHVQCRCTAIPALTGRPSPIAESGEAWFDKQPEATQRAIIGTNAGYEALKNGALRLRAFVGEQRNPLWGKSFVQLSVKRAMDGEGQFPGGKPEIALPVSPPAPRLTAIEESPEATRMIAALFGQDVSRERIAGAIGALDGASIKFAVEGRRLVVYAKHPDVTHQVRHIYRKGRRLVLYNELFMKAPMARPGVGADMLARQVEFAPGLGFKGITTEAAGSIDSDTFNGYYTWPRFGYDAPIPSYLRSDLPANLRSARTILDLFETDAGREWWRQHGETVIMNFDLSPNSRSRQVLERYRAEKKRNG